MKPLHWVAVLFWILVTVMILKGCHDSDVHRDQVDAQTQKHFFFSHPPAAPKQFFLPSQSPNADVQQISFVVHPDTPYQGQFTCDVTVKNMGGKKAIGVQVAVRPFRGAMRGDDNLGGRTGGFSMVKDNDPLAQQTSWLTFPDLAPGAQGTQSAVFLGQPNVTPGKNPKPEIDFQNAKDPSTP